MKSVNVKKYKAIVGFKGIRCDYDPDVLDLDYAACADNFAFENGVLTGKIGIDYAHAFDPNDPAAHIRLPDIESGKSVKNLFLYRRAGKGDRLVALTEDGEARYTSAYGADSWHTIEGLRTTGDASAVNYNFNGKDTLLICSDKDPMYLLDDERVTACEAAPRFTSIAVHGERVFGAVSGEKNRVWFSSNFDPTQWDTDKDAGYIDFHDECGEALKVTSFGGYMFIFREYGIMRLEAYGFAESFVLKRLFTDVGRIVKHSITTCGNRIVFYAETGLFAFDGYAVSRLTYALPKLKITPSMTAAYLDDRYYLACRRSEKEGSENDTVIRYDVPHKQIAVLTDASVKAFCRVNVAGGAETVCVMNASGAKALGAMSESGKIFGANTKKRYASGYALPTVDGIKTVRGVSTVTAYPVTLKVVADERTYEYKLRGSDSLQTVYVERSGRRIRFELETDKDKAHVAPIIADINVLEV